MKKMENVADIYPLTPVQQGMLFHTLSEPESEVYFEQIRCNLIGNLNIARLKSAWDFVIDHYPALRTAFLWEKLENPLQIVRQTVSPSWEVFDWRQELTDQDTKLDKLAQNHRQKGFDLASAPLMRFVLIQFDDQSHHFIWNFHHLLLDGWSTHQVFYDAFNIYEMLCKNQRPFLPPTKPFRNYIAWLKKQDLDIAEKYWRKRLAGFSAPTPFQVDRNDSTAAIRYGESKIELSTSTSAALQQFAQQSRVTLNTVVQGAWALLLSRYSGQDDVVFGNIGSGRPLDLPGVEKMVGMFINTLPVRVKLSHEQHLVTWLQAIQQRQLETRRYEYSPLVKVQQWSDIAPGLALFDSIVVFENYPVREAAAQHSLQIRNIQYRELSNYPLAILIYPGERLRILTIYNSNRFEPDTVARLLNHLQTILAVMAVQSPTTLADIPMLEKGERDQLLAKWNQTAIPIESDEPVFQAVGNHAAQKPNAKVIIAQDGVLTYGQFEERTNQLAHLLIEKGVKPGTAVGLFSERSVMLLVGIIGIQKAGGCYVPLDPGYPASRISVILEDSHAPMIVAQRKIAGDLPETGAEIIQLDPQFSMLDGFSTATPNTAVGLDDLAYIIYTSGSTGKPKGVMVTHGNLLSSTAAREATYKDPIGRYLLLSSFAFDSSVAGIFWTLYSGGTLVLPAPDDEKDVSKLATIIEREQVTHTLALPSLYRLLLTYAPEGSLASLQVAIVAGEMCPPDLGKMHYSLLPQSTLYNEYGPTEATVWCSVYKLPADGDGGVVPIGRPIANSQLYILDRRRQPVPMGIPGELYVGGAGVTPGYWNNEPLTEARFPILAIDGYGEIGRVYRTGDLARWRPDGEIEFLGRVDDQVKIRGYRIEPGEIEALLRQYPPVADTAVVGKAFQNGTVAGNGLVAYIVPEPDEREPIDQFQVQDYLGQLLPDYMVPRQVVILPMLPRLPNGKVNVRRLPLPAEEAGSRRPFVPPQSPVERKLADIWCEVLRLSEVSIEDRFFELGGDSIMIIQVIARARQEGIELSPRQLLAEQTIKRLAAIAAGETEQPTYPVLVPLNEEGTRPPVFFVHGISGSLVWLTNVLPLLNPDQPVYGLQSYGFHPDGEPDPSIENMARRYLEAVKQIQPSGPYYFGGFCFGGIVAYEMARQLELIGEKTALLAVLDAAPESNGHRKRSLLNPLRLQIIRESAPYWFQGYKVFGGWRLKERIFRKFNWQFEAERNVEFSIERLAQIEFMEDFVATEREIRVQINDINQHIQKAYKPKTYGGHVTVFAPRLLGVGQAIFGEVDPRQEWRRLAAGGVSCRFVAGSHVGFLRSPFVADLASQLNDALDQAMLTEDKDSRSLLSS